MIRSVVILPIRISSIIINKDIIGYESRISFINGIDIIPYDIKDIKIV